VIAASNENVRPDDGSRSPGAQPAFGAHAPRGLFAWLLARTRAAGEGRLARRMAFVLRGLAVRLLHGKPVDTHALGAAMRLYPYNNVSEKRILFMPQYFDAQERAVLASRLQGDFVFIDIGANIGGYALFAAAREGARGRVLAIEPQPEIFQRLVYNISQNPGALVKAMACAVADEDGEITLFIDRQNRGETSVRIVKTEGAGGSIRVPAKTLAAIAAEEGYTKIDAIKLDVEGAEDLILEPFFRTAPQSLWPKLIVMEHLHQRWTVDLRVLLEQLGYSTILRTRNNTVWERG